MRVIIAGSRTITVTPNVMDELIRRSGFSVDTVVSGGAQGIDQSGEAWAKAHNTEAFPDINLHVYLADWDKYGKSAGYKRNELMAQNADALIAIWDGKSRGTKHMLDIAKAAGLPIKLYMRKAA